MRILHFRRLATAALLLLSSAYGCTGTPSGEGGLSLPSFGAPEQWEPEVQESPTSDDDDES